MRNIERMNNASGAQSPHPVAKTQNEGFRRPRRKARSCLNCRQSFMGSGPGERICETCKASDDWANAVAATKGFIEW